MPTGITLSYRIQERYHRSRSLPNISGNVLLFIRTSPDPYYQWCSRVEVAQPPLCCRTRNRPPRAELQVTEQERERNRKIDVIAWDRDRKTVSQAHRFDEIEPALRLLNDHKEVLQGSEEQFGFCSTRSVSHGDRFASRVPRTGPRRSGEFPAAAIGRTNCRDGRGIEALYPSLNRPAGGSPSPHTPWENPSDASHSRIVSSTIGDSCSGASARPSVLDSRTMDTPGALAMAVVHQLCTWVQHGRQREHGPVER